MWKSYINSLLPLFSTIVTVLATVLLPAEMEYGCIYSKQKVLNQWDKRSQKSGLLKLLVDEQQIEVEYQEKK